MSLDTCEAKGLTRVISCCPCPLGRISCRHPVHLGRWAKWFGYQRGVVSYEGAGCDPGGYCAYVREHCGLRRLARGCVSVGGESLSPTAMYSDVMFKYQDTQLKWYLRFFSDI